jgi:hypothetical protein
MKSSAKNEVAEQQMEAREKVRRQNRGPDCGDFSMHAA